MDHKEELFKRGDWVTAKVPMTAFMLMPGTGGNEILVRQSDAGIVQWTYNRSHCIVRWNSTGRQLVVRNELIERIDTPAEMIDQCIQAINSQHCFDLSNPCQRDIYHKLQDISRLLHTGEIDITSDREPLSS